MCMVHLQRDPVVFSGRESVDIIVPKLLHHSRQLSVTQPVIVVHHMMAPGVRGPSVAADESLSASFWVDELLSL